MSSDTAPATPSAPPSLSVLAPGGVLLLDVRDWRLTAIRKRA